MSDEQAPFMTHLEELRKRLIVAGSTWLVAFFVCYGFSEDLFRFVSEPARNALPPGSSLIFLTATEPFFTYMKISALAALIVSLPVILWQVWSFVAPGLYAHEKRFAIPFVLVSCLCFASGAYFGFVYLFPTIFSMLIKFGIGEAGVSAMLSMGAYLSLSMRLMLAFGLIFELPIVIFLLARMGIVDHIWLRRHRKYMVIVAFVVAAIATPGPDVISQIALAGPFVILYEIGVLLARFFGKKKTAVEEGEEVGSTPETEQGA
jgi:sec-independent protein translocase protein TatC